MCIWFLLLGQQVVGINFYQWRTAYSRKEAGVKTLSAEIRQQRDCDSRWVADSVIKVIVVYESHIGI